MIRNRISAKAAMFVAGVFFGQVLFAQTTVTYTYSGLPAPIYTDAANVITVLGITVPVALTITKVTAQVQIQYPNSGDLNIYLFSPQGTRTILLQHDCSVANVNTTFDDAAPSAWKDFCPTEAGRGPFKSDQPLSNFNSDGSAFGTWRLAVENDTSDSRSGFITGFSLTITGTTQLNPATSADSIVNGASLTGSGTIAPGEVISIFGAALGPSTGVSAPAGALPTTLSGTSVLVNGAAIPLLYVSAFQINAQVPFNIAAGGTATLQVNAASGSSSAITLNTTDVLPGLYTTGSGLVRPANTVNQDGSINSSLHPAPKGSYISLYGSGFGTLSPALTAGAVPPSSPLSSATGTVTAEIGGQPATVQFAGAAPGYPGLYQVNLQVPSTILSGTRLVEVFVNGQPTQLGTTVQIQ
jgi:uncharacterized protein (TIGR03437 family)